MANISLHSPYIHPNLDLFHCWPSRCAANASRGRPNLTAFALLEPPTPHKKGLGFRVLGFMGLGFFLYGASEGINDIEIQRDSIGYIGLAGRMEKEMETTTRRVVDVGR